jgi:hypothetical protein
LPVLTAEDTTSALSSLLGLSPGALPDPAVARVAMICEARRRGITWAQIAPAMGCENGKQAKAVAKRLAKQANQSLIRTAMEQLKAA